MRFSCLIFVLLVCAPAAQASRLLSELPDDPGAPYPDVTLTDVRHDYVVGTGLSITGRATGLAHGGGFLGNARTSNDTIYQSLIPVPNGVLIGGDFVLNVELDSSGNLIKGDNTFSVSGGLPGTAGTGTDGGINWDPHPTLPAPFGTAGSSTLLTGQITEIYFNQGANTVAFGYQLTGGELMDFGGPLAIGFGSPGSPGFMELRGFDLVEANGAAAFAADFDNLSAVSGGNGDIKVPVPTTASLMLSLLFPVLLLGRRSRRLASC